MTRLIDWELGIRIEECDTCRGLGGWGTSYCYALEEYEGWEDCPDCDGTGEMTND